MKKTKGIKAMKEVALNNGVSMAEVHREIAFAITVGTESSDPEIQAYLYCVNTI